MRDFKSKEACFLKQIIEDEGVDKSSNPMLSAFASQMGNILLILDSNIEYQVKIGGILTKIKENWDG